jgi:hypothetical protein
MHEAMIDAMEPLSLYIQNGADPLIDDRTVAALEE